MESEEERELKKEEPELTNENSRKKPNEQKQAIEPNTEPTPRRGQRQRGKPTFLGQNVMVSQIKEI